MSACHACALPADLRPSTFGWLCSGCWERVLVIIERIIGGVSRWRT
jgi:hypothetical protein